MEYVSVPKTKPAKIKYIVLDCSIKGNSQITRVICETPNKYKLQLWIPLPLTDPPLYSPWHETLWIEKNSTKIIGIFEV